MLRAAGTELPRWDIYEHKPVHMHGFSLAVLVGTRRRLLLERWIPADIQQNYSICVWYRYADGNTAHCMSVGASGRPQISAHDCLGDMSHVLGWSKSSEPRPIYKIISEVLEKLKTPSCSLSLKEQNGFFKF